MPYPIVEDMAARAWWRGWDAMARGPADPQRCAPPPSPAVGQSDSGASHDWTALAEKVVAALSDSLADKSAGAAFEAEAAIIMHKGLPSDEALADPQFWIWLAVVPGNQLVLDRYAPTQPKPIPHRSNFTSASAKETLFYRLWLRAEIARDPAAEDEYHLARYGDVDFWRSHVFRQMYAEHHDLLAAFLEFQYPNGPSGDPRLKGTNQSEIRELVKYLRRAFANVNVEMMDQARALRFIEGEWAKIEAGKTTA
jgi:hypothetical protein